MIDREFILKELLCFDEYDVQNIKNLNDDELLSLFNSHCDKYAVEVTAEDLVNNYTTVNFLMDSPDGFVEVGDFWIKSNKNIITINTIDDFNASVSVDHLFQTPTGWVKAGELNKTEMILTKSGYKQINRIHVWKNKETTYDWEILTNSHRYWAGNGLSSHNTGKTYLIMNACKQAQDQGYYIVYYDSENAVDKTLLSKFKIDMTKFRYEPVNTVQEFRSNITAMLDTLIENKEKGFKIPKIMVCLDSAGNLATQKEIEDAKSKEDKADMTRAKLLKSTFRILMTKMALCHVNFIFSNHSYSCLTGDTKVLLADGQAKCISELNIGDSVRTLNGTEDILNIFTYENAPTIELKLANDTIIKCTPNHKFLIDEDWTKETSWKQASELDEDDEIYMI